MKYYVSVTETLNKVVCVEAESEKMAVDAVQNAYDMSDIILDSDNFAGVQIEIEQDQDFYQYEESLGNSYWQEIKA